MITVIDNDIKPGKAVRTLVYTAASELTGSTVETSNAGTVQCEIGSVAMTAGFGEIMQLGENGWVLAEP